eukprot:PhM_4_TR7759/c0_g1_i1/m.93803
MSTQPPHDIARPTSPAHFSSGDFVLSDSVTIGAPSLSPFHVAVAHRLRVALCSQGTQCMFAASGADVGTPAWRHRMLSHLKDSLVYVPLVSHAWLDDDVSLLELYYALRQWVINGQPVVVPIIFDDAPTTQLTDMLRQACFHVMMMPNPQGDEIHKTALKIQNLAQQLLGNEFTTEKPTLESVYTTTFQQLGGKKMNTAISKLIGTVTQAGTSPTEALLADNYIGDIGVRAFFLTLVPRWPLLHKIVVSCNGLNNDTVRCLCDAVVYHPALTYIDLSRNVEVTQQGGAELLLLARRNQLLRTIDVDGTSIPQVWKKKLEAQLTINRSSETFVADGANSMISGPLPILQTPPTMRETSSWTIHVAVDSNVSMVTVNGSVTLAGQGETKQLPSRSMPSLCAPIKAWMKTMSQNTIVLQGLNGKKMMFVLETESCAMLPIVKLIQMELKIADSAAYTRIAMRLVVSGSSAGENMLVELSVGLRNNTTGTPQTLARRGLVRLLKEENMFRANGNLQDELCELVVKAYERDMLDDADVAQFQAAEDVEEEHTLQTQKVVASNVVTQWKGSSTLAK